MLFLAGALVALAGTPANLQEALQAQRALVVAHPTDADLLNDLGNLLALAGDLDEAEEVYRRALAIDPVDVTAQYNLALVLNEQGKAKEALHTLQSILESEPRHAWTHYQLGTLYADKNNRKQAVHHYAEAFSIDRSLTSPKVNPHIIENRLATEAMLRMHIDESPSTQAPRIYEEPGDVADLLLPPASAPPAAEPVTETTPKVETEPVPRRNRTTYDPPAASEGSDDSDDPATQDAREQEDELSATPAPSGDRSSEDPDQAAPRMIDSSTLGSGRTGQAGSGANTSPKEVDPNSSASTPRSSLPPRSAPSRDPGTSSGDPTSSPSDFLPGVESTGRLDIELLPAVEPAPATSPT